MLVRKNISKSHRNWTIIPKDNLLQRVNSELIELPFATSPSSFVLLRYNKVFPWEEMFVILNFKHYEGMGITFFLSCLFIRLLRKGVSELFQPLLSLIKGLSKEFSIYEHTSWGKFAIINARNDRGLYPFWQMYI